MARKIKNFDEYSQKTQTGAELFNQKKYEDAYSVFLELSEYNTDNYKVFETLALICIKLNKIDEAEKAFKKAADLFSKKSKVELKLKSFEEVITELESIDELEIQYQEKMKNHTPDSENSNNSFHHLPVMMGMHYMAQGNYKKAENLLVKHRKKFFKER